MDEFTVESKTGKKIIFQLVKQDNGDFRIKKGKSVWNMLSGKHDAIQTFEKMRQRLSGQDTENTRINIL